MLEKPTVDDNTDAGIQARPRSSVAIIILVSGLAGVLLYFAHAVFIPIALAVLFALLLSMPVEALHRRRVPRSISALLILVAFLAVVVGTVVLLWNPAQAWLAAAPRTSQIIQQRIRPAAKIMQRIDAASNQAGHLSDAPPGRAGSTQATPAQPSAPAASSASSGILAQTQELMISALTVVMLSLFLLAAGPPVLARMSATFASNVQGKHVLEVIEAVRSEMGRYYATIALINLGLGIATFVVALSFGMPNPILWGTLAAILNFIPYVGSATTFVVLAIVAFVSFDTIGRVLAVTGSYLALATLEGQVVQPLLVGQRLELNPIIVFLAVWFGGWFWGIPGIVLAIPSLVALKVVAEHNVRGASLVEFLSPGKVKRFKPGSIAIKRSKQKSNS